MAPPRFTGQDEESLARLEFERACQAISARRGERAAVSRRVARAYGMLCPRCGSELVRIRYRGIELDKCSACEGIWVGRSDLERLEAPGDSFVSGMLKIFRGLDPGTRGDRELDHDRPLPGEATVLGRLGALLGIGMILGILVWTFFFSR
ncbi:MAG: zf-TFIIB domain-containing protein [Candidatus Rokubacteria bacterium]|nr:zf-TFIIB domain-containing protein [Candidatus Rokubacteria bacterium]